MFGNFQFQQPWFLLLLLLIPLLGFIRLLVNKRQKPVMKTPTLNAFPQGNSLLAKLKPSLFLLRLLAFSLFIIAMARPRTVDVSLDYESEKGIDILMVVDTSLSMMAKDLLPNRLSRLKKVVEDFAMNRLVDRIGLVEYSGEAVTRVPLTTDREILVEETRSLESGQLYQGTAIGVGLATGINHLKDSKAKSKVIILVTDGVESIDETANLIYEPPMSAAEIAKNLGIKVYTIGIGTNGFALFPYGRDIFSNSIQYRRMPVEIDEELLEDIASLTDGKYFRATDNESLEEIFSEIDQLEKTEINSIKYYTYNEYFASFLLPGLIILLLELLLRATVYRELL